MQFVFLHHGENKEENVSKYYLRELVNDSIYKVWFEWSPHPHPIDL
jgi:hypothetical protein